MLWRETKLYGYIKPHIPNILRSCASLLQQTIRNKIATRRELDFRSFRLLVSNRDSGGIAHESIYWHELGNPLEAEIVRLLGPRVFIDVGANYGFASVLHFSRNPKCKVIAIEPNPVLISYIDHNLRQAGCRDFTIFNAICGAEDLAQTSFSINPSYSQDSRVVGPPTWRHVEVPAVTLDRLTESLPHDTPTLIKVDTQGYEAFVLRGGQNFLLRSENWLMKIEFAPRWLEAQETNPVRLLQTLVDEFIVCELPTRIRFKGETLEDLCCHPLVPEECEAFERYIRNLSKEEGGYCDLLVFPRRSPLLSRANQNAVGCARDSEQANS